VGLDTVEIVMRCEEIFAIGLPDRELEYVITVGDLYTLICEKLGLTPHENPTTEIGIDRLPRGTLNLTAIPWTSKDVRATIVAIFVDQMCLEREDVTYTSRIGEDLRID